VWSSALWAISLGTGTSRHLRSSIGRPPRNLDPADYVLATFRPDERDAVDAVDAAMTLAPDLIARFVEEPAASVR
jgi:peptidyl-tRNA hydrolase